MDERHLRDAYRAGVDRQPRGPECLAPEALDRLARREGTEAERVAALDHVMSCPACLRDFELLRAVQASARAEATPVRRRLPVPWLAAAVVFLAAGTVVLIPRLRHPALVTDPVRGGDSVVVVGTPALTGARPVFDWRAVPSALSYSVEILDSADRVVAGGTVLDTTWVLPDSVTLRPGTTYRWLVAATTRDGGEIRSAPHRFTAPR